MNQKELLEIAQEACPELMQKTAQAIALVERLAPEFVEDVMEDVQAITDVTMDKVAGVTETVANFALKHGKEYGTKVLTAVGVGVGTAIATDLYDAARRGLSKGRNWKRIMDANPNLKNEVRDPARLKPAFNTLHRYAPDFTADPMLGGSLLQQLANQPPGNEHLMIKELLGSRSNLRTIKNNQFKINLPFGKKKDKDDDDHGDGDRRAYKKAQGHESPYR